MLDNKTPYQQFILKIRDCDHLSFYQNMFGVNRCTMCGANPIEIKFALENYAKDVFEKIQKQIKENHLTEKKNDVGDVG